MYLFCVIKRYARIMPAYAYLLWYYFKVTPVLMEGPFAQTNLRRWICNSTNFWESFILGLHADTYGTTMCAGWAWYLALDFRLFLTIPALLIFTTFFHPKQRKIVGMSICSILALASIVWSFHKIYQNNVWYTNVQDKNATNDRYYYA